MWKTIKAAPQLFSDSTFYENVIYYLRKSPCRLLCERIFVFLVIAQLVINEDITETM